MTVTLPLDMARRSSKEASSTAVPPPTPGTACTGKRPKSRAPPISTVKRKGTSSAPPAEQAVPIYEQFGTLPPNPSYHLARVGQAIRQARNVIVISGAGVSTPAIPDFRSSKGLFKTLADDVMRKDMYGSGEGREGGDEDGCVARTRTAARKRNTQTDQGGSSNVATSSKSGMKSGKELFDVKCLTSPDLLPHHHNLLNHLTLLTSRTSPTPFHHYLKTLDDEGRLLRCYTQNIDGLEEKAGLDLRIPLEQDFPKRRRTGMSRESSRKSDVFGKKEVQVPPEIPVQDRDVGPTPGSLSGFPRPETEELLGVPSRIGPVHAVSLPISRLLNASNDYCNLYPYAHAHPTVRNVLTHVVADGFEIDQTFVFNSKPLEHPYPAESDPFCQRAGPSTYQDSHPVAETIPLDSPCTVNLDKGLPSPEEAFTKGMGNAGSLLSVNPGMALPASESLSARPGSPTVRATSAACSVSGTTDTSATSVSGKIQVGEEIDNDRDIEKADLLQPPAETTDPSLNAASLPQAGPAEGPKLPRCVPLHGTLANLECTRCSYSQPLRDAIPLPPEMLPCPSCEDAWEERVESSQRPRSIGFLRASVLLYGEEHRHGDSIGAVVERDLLGRLKDERMDLLIVAGTTLQIPGVKRMIKEFAKALRTQPATKKKMPRKSSSAADQSAEKDASSAGTSRSATLGEADDADQEDFPIQTILLNRDPPGKGKGGEWANTFDVWVQGDLQEFVQQWVVNGPSPDAVAQELTIAQSASTTTEVPFALSPNTQRRIEVTKVEGTKILLSLEKASHAPASSVQGKRKEPPSPEKSIAKGKARSRAKNPKLAPGIPFASAKPGVKSSPRKRLGKRMPASPDTHSSGSDDLCVLIAVPNKRSRRGAASPSKPKSTKTRSATSQTRKEPAQQLGSPTRSLAATHRSKTGRPAKPRTEPTRRSLRQQKADSSDTALPKTARKRSYESACSSSLSSSSSSDLSPLPSDNEECSSQGIVEGIVEN